MAATAIIVIAEGFEEIEAITPADMLRRAGVEVEMVGLDALEVTGAHEITLKMDRTLRDDEDADAVILPGGMPGATNLAASARLANVLRRQFESGRLIAAICASPGVVLAPLGILDGKRAACYPGFEQNFRPGTTHVLEPVVKDGNIITSRGPGTALAYALAIAAELAGSDVADGLAKAMLHAS